LLRNPWLRPINDPVAIDDLLRQINPLWSLVEVRARVVDVIDEARDVRSFVLQPNRLWPGFRAGQHVAVEVEIGGVRCHRSYSLSSAPDDANTVTITVKRQPKGRVSGWLHEQVRIGDVLTLSRPAGDFVLPDDMDRTPLLMLSAGSGITPVMSMLRALRVPMPEADVIFVHCCHDKDDAIFGDELRELAQTWPTLRLVHWYTAQAGRLDEAALQQLVPDRAQRQTLLCGPDGFMSWIENLWRKEGLLDRLRTESFTGVRRRPRPDSAADQRAIEVRCATAQRSFAGTGEQSLLVEAEAAGLSPPHGCRAGICRTCMCRKKSGVVENLLTGRVSAEPDEWIQLCVSAARSDVELDL
jgi:ferredoxin-NADP reductase